MYVFFNGVLNDTTSWNGFSNETTFSKQLTLGSYNWSVIACNNLSSCGISEFRDFNISEVVFNSQTYNTSTSESSPEQFIVNIS